MWRVALGIGLAAAGGCQNACQEICGRMADYATEDCGITVADSEIDACVERQSADAEREELKVCRDFGDAEVIRAQWSCEDLADYWGAAPEAESR